MKMAAARRHGNGQVPNLTSLLVHREFCKLPTTSIDKIKESLIESSMIEPLNESWPDWLKDERDYRLVSSFRQGHGHKYPDWPSPEVFYIAAYELSRMVYLNKINYALHKEMNKEDLIHFFSYYSLKQPCCSNWYDEGFGERMQSMNEERDNNLVEAYKSRKSGVVRNPGYIPGKGRAPNKKGGLFPFPGDIQAYQKLIAKGNARKERFSKYFLNIDEIHRSNEHLYVYPYHTEDTFYILEGNTYPWSR